MTGVTLYYFPIRGRGEASKLIGAAGGLPIEFKEVDEVQMKADRTTYPFGQCPRLQDGDLNLCQSNAIIRHLARKTGLNGASDKEAALVDMVVEGVEALRPKYIALIYKDELAAPAKAAFWDTHCDPSTANGRNGGAHLAFLEELLKANSSGYMVGAGLTAADLCVFDIVDLLLRVYPDQLPSAYPHLHALHKRVEDHPNIKAYLASPQRLAMANGNGLG